MSDGDRSAVKMDTVAWLAGFKQGKASVTNSNLNPGYFGTERNRIRRSSSKDVEEAMAGGLSKVNHLFQCIHKVSSGEKPQYGDTKRVVKCH